jgi:hypothetical protein
MTNQKKRTMKKTLLSVLLLVAPLAAQASAGNDLSFTFAELDYMYTSDSIDSQGFRLQGSLQLGESYFLNSSYSRAKLEDWGGHNSVDTFVLGGGYFVGMGAADWVTQVAYIRDDVNLHLAQFQIQGAPDRVSGHVEGFQLSSGVRGRISESLSGHAYLGYRDMSDVKVTRRSIHLDGDMYSDLGIDYRFNDRWSATGNVMLVGGSTEFLTGVRASF